MPEFPSDDFKKGWQTHQICDLVYESVVKKIFDDIFPKDCDFSVEKNWENITAMKIILDMEDMQAFDIQRYLDCLEYVHNPNDEDIEEIKRSNQLIIGLYKNKKNTTIDDAISNLLLFIPKADICEQTKVAAKNFLKNDRVLAKIRTIYQEMLNSYLNIENRGIF